MEMSKDSKITTQTRWKEVEIDCNGEQKLQKGDSVFEEVSATDLFASIVNNGKGIVEVMEKLVKMKDYLKSRSEQLSEDLNSTIQEYFEQIRITLPKPFNEAQWHELETMDKEDLNKTTFLFNGIPATTFSIVKSFGTFITSLSINVKHAEVFPFNVDSYGIPPINCRKIWNPLLWMRSEMEKKIREHCQHDPQPLNQLVTALNLAPKEGHLEKLAITSFFLENTADNLDYSEDKPKFLENLKAQFGSLKVDELTIVLPDILLAYSEDLLEGFMQVSYFIPFELIRLALLSWKPKVLKLRLRTEACSSIEDAARIEWDDEEVFTSTTLFNCPLFDRCEPVCLGKEQELVDCQLIVDATGSRLLDPVHNEQNVYTAGRDFLVMFPMQTVFIKRAVPLKTGASVKTQIKKQVEFIVNTFFYNPEEHSGRSVSYQLQFLNSGDVQLAMVKKCIPKSANGRSIGVSFGAEAETKEVFEKFGGTTSNSQFFVSFFDADHQVIVDLKIELSRA